MKNACKLFSVLSVGMLGLTLSVNAQAATTNDLVDCVNNTTDGVCTLSENVTLNTQLNITKNVTIDLNGYDITMTGEGGSDYALTFALDGGSFTLKDSKKTGKVTNEKGRGVLISEGDLTLDGVTVQSKDRALQVYAQNTKKAKATLKSGKLETLVGNSKTRTVFLAGDNQTQDGAVFVMEDGEVIAPISVKDSAAINIGNQNSGGTSATINGGTVKGYNGVRLYGNGTDKMTVFTMNGGTVNAAGSGVIMSNNDDAENVDVYLYGGKIEAKDMEGQAHVGGDAVAVNQSQNGKLVIGKEDGTGPTLIGETGVAIKKGDVTVNGGSIKATGEYRAQPTKNDDGTEDTGAAISITSISNTQDVKLTIAGGDITSDNGNALYEGIAKDRTDVTKSTVSALEISGGNFTSAEGKESVVAEKYESTFIKGGSFNTPVTEYLANEELGQSESGAVGEVHKVTVADTENGTVDVNKTAVKGEEVTVYAIAEDGYKIGTIVVTDADGKEVEVTDGTFIMPGTDVTVTVTFTSLDAEASTPENAENPSTLDNVLTYVAVGTVSIVTMLGGAVALRKHN